jgi:hypothetical protein
MTAAGIGIAEFRLNTESVPQLLKGLDDQGKMDKRREHHIEFFESGENAAEAFESAK